MAALLEGRGRQGEGSGGAGGGQMSRKLSGKDGPQQSEAGPLGKPAVDGLGAGQDIEPQPVDHGIEAARDPVGIGLAIATGSDNLLAEGPSLGEIALRQGLADLQVFRPPAGLAPEGVPDRDLFAAGHDRIEIGGDDRRQLIGRPGSGLAEGRRPELLVFGRHELQRLDEEGFLAAEIEIDDALGQPRALGDLRQRELGESMAGEAVDGRLDQLRPPRFLDVQAPHSPPKPAARPVSSIPQSPSRSNDRTIEHPRGRGKPP